MHIIHNKYTLAIFIVIIPRMSRTNHFESNLIDGLILEDSITTPVRLDAIPIPGASDLHTIPDKCHGCWVGYLPEGQPRVISAIDSEIWRCKSVDDCNTDEQLAIAVSLNLPPEVITRLIDDVFQNEQRRANSMHEFYSEPETLTLLRQKGIYPHPTPDT